MVCLLQISSTNLLIKNSPSPILKIKLPRKSPSLFCIKPNPVSCFDSHSSGQEPNNPENPSSFPNLINPSIRKNSTPFISSIVISPKNVLLVKSDKGNRKKQHKGGYWGDEKESEVGKKQLLLLCGFGYWIQGIRCCFPWLALNFHMAHSLNFHPSVLQLVQNCGNIPMVAKPLYGILSDALYIGGAHRIPYISIGVVLQVLAWAPLALLPFVGEALPTLMTCVLLSNLGAAITEVAQDALVAEYGQKNKIIGLQSYTFMAIAVAGIIGNLLGGFILSKSHTRMMFLTFTCLLLLQLVVSLITKEEEFGLSRASNDNVVGGQSVTDSVRKQYRDLVAALSEEKVSHPLIWVVASIAVVPILSGSIFCYQIHCLNLDPSIIGMSRVIGQVVLLSVTVLYNWFWKRMNLRSLIGTVQILYAVSLLLDLVLVKQINLRAGISNEVFVLCFSGLAETIATFKTMPFFVLIASLCPQGCEASLTSFLASALCLSSILSGFLGIGLTSMIGIRPDSYSSLPVGILVQFLAAVVPLGWLGNLPGGSEPSSELLDEGRKKGWSRSRSRRCLRITKAGRIVMNSFFSYWREKESEGKES